MSERTLVISATNVLARGFLLVPTDRMSRGREPVNGLFAVARAIRRVLAFKRPARAIGVIDAQAAETLSPAILVAQLPSLPGLLEAMGMHVVVAPDEVHVVASYAQAALDAGDDAIVVGVDKRYAQLVSDRLWWYDANKDTRYTTEIVHKRFAVDPDKVAEWLALVGDEDTLPGVAGIGAKGATTLLETYGSIHGAVAAIDEIKGRLGNALRAARDQLPAELARARLDTRRPLPRPLGEASYLEPAAAVLNETFDRFGFVELLVSDGGAIRVEVSETDDAVRAMIATLAGPTTLHALLEDTGMLVGIALAVGAGEARYVPIGGLESLDPHDRSYAERLARRATHEGSVADVSRRALLEADRALLREGLGAVPLLQVLDEVLFEVPEDELERAARVTSTAMRHAFELEVPLVVGVEAGRTWADLERIDYGPA